MKKAISVLMVAACMLCMVTACEIHSMPDSTPQAVVWNCIVFVLWLYFKSSRAAFKIRP